MTTHSNVSVKVGSRTSLRKFRSVLRSHGWSKAGSGWAMNGLFAGAVSMQVQCPDGHTIHVIVDTYGARTCLYSGNPVFPSR